VALFLVALAAGIGVSMTRRRTVTRVNAPETGLAGRTGRLISDEPEGARVRLGDSDWPARLLEPAAPGSAVVVAGVDGTTLLVRPQQSATPHTP
ncbi:MAG: NfeD family protein, partial [Alphaproteobacteria bacterium]|nr:NfeD family protein [Alphaproteobacteria bacterium]